MIGLFVRYMSVSVFLIVILAGCFEPKTQTPITLKLNWKHGSDFLGFYIAQTRGMYAEEGLKVTIEELSNSKEGIKIFDQVVAGDYSFSAAGLSLKKAQSSGLPLTAIANITKYSPGTFFARADSGIVTPKDFAGRRVAIKNKTWEEIIVEFLAQAGLTMDDIQAVPVGWDMKPFYDGDIDVWAGFLNEEPVRARLKGLEIVNFPLYEYGFRTPALSIYTSRKSLSENPERAEAFLRATIRGWVWAIENPTEAVDTMLSLYPQMSKDREYYLASFDAMLPLISPPGVAFGSIDCDAWLNDELFQNVQDPEKICTTRIFELAQKEGES